MRKSFSVFTILTTAGAFIILNAAALLSTSFYNLWVGVFFWIPVIDPSLGHGLVFAIGAIIGLMIFVGAVIVLMGYSKEGGLLNLPLAVLSLIIGGGFVAGFALGVLGGILGITTHDVVKFRTPTAFMFCRECGSRISRASKYCPNCGFDLISQDTRMFSLLRHVRWT